MKVSENQRLILGPPGTGKTTYNLADIESRLASGDSPDRIAFVSFTKKAVNEAVNRASEKFKLRTSELPLFRTIHSLAFNSLGISKREVMGREHFREFGDWLGYRFEGTWDEADGVPVGSELGDTLLFLDNLARVTMRPLKQIWEENYTECEWDELERFQDAYQDFKSSKGVMDFTDMLYGYISMCDPTDAEFAYIDEAQDLSPIQWAVLQHAFGGVRLTTISGDDDQSIFKWSGADVNQFLSLGGEKTVLSKSYRLNRQVHETATSISSKIVNRFDKKFSPRDEDGVVDYINILDNLQLDPNEQTMFLVRNTFISKKITEYLRRNGIPYIGRLGYSSLRNKDVLAIYAIEKLRKQEEITGREAKAVYDSMRVGYFLERGYKTKIQSLSDAERVNFTRLNQEYGLKDLAPWYDCLDGIDKDHTEYYRRVRANGYSLTHTPTCSVSTIHSAKGGEASHVVVLSDMAFKSHQEYEKEPDNERRVAYVAVTRARNRLTIVQPQTKLYFDYFREGN